MPPEDHQAPPICDYEGSDYQERFWGQGQREYEDRVEAIAIRRLLPKNGDILLEVGAGAGRNTDRYPGYERIVLLDYSTTQLAQAQQLLGTGDRYVYVAADVYKLPFVDGLFDGATMIRVIHHMADAPRALAQIRQVLAPKATFLLEYANKRNLKAIARYLLGRQEANPFAPEPLEFIKLNFNFHPAQMGTWLREHGFRIQRQLSVSYLRAAWLKRNFPLGFLVAADSLLQYTGGLAQLSPSVFIRSQTFGDTPLAEPGAFFKCPECGTGLPGARHNVLRCPNCGLGWGIEYGIYNFRRPLKP